MLIGFGGGDRTVETLQALEALRPVVDAETQIDVVVAAASAHEAIAAKCAEFPHATLHVQTARMAELIAAADLALGAGGVSALERCCLGLPSIVLTVAENQVPGSRQLARAGAALYLGRADNAGFRLVQSAFHTLKSSPELMCHMSQAASELVDANGALRVARKMLEPSISLRRATTTDRDVTYTWRNAIETRRGAFDPSPIDYETHVRWFDATLANPRRALLIGECDEDAIGVLRFDLDEFRATVSVYLDPGLQGLGHGPALLEQGEKWLRAHHPEVQEVHALVRSDNPASLAAFTAAGYEPHGQILRKPLGNEP